MNFKHFKTESQCRTYDITTTRVVIWLDMLKCSQLSNTSKLSQLLTVLAGIYDRPVKTSHTSFTIQKY